SRGARRRDRGIPSPRAPVRRFDRADRIVAMEEANPAGGKASSGPPFLARHRNLVLRIASAVVLVPLALGTAYAGGTVFLAFWAIAALLVLWEWMTLVCTHD